jgi:hypothetical protein
VHPAQRLRRQDQVRIRTRAEQRRADSEEAGIGVDLVGAEIERRPHEHVPEAFDGGVARTKAAQHGAEGLARLRARAAATGRDDGDPHPVAQRQMRVGQQGSDAGLHVGAAAVLVVDGQDEPSTHVRGAFTDAIEEPEVLAEAAEGDVLAVVRRRGRVALPLRQRLHRTAEGRPRLVHGHVVTGVDELQCSRQSRQTAADDRRLHQSPRPTMRSFVSADSRGGPSKTSKPRSSIRSSVSR